MLLRAEDVYLFWDSTMGAKDVDALTYYFFFLARKKGFRW